MQEHCWKLIEKKTQNRKAVQLYSVQKEFRLYIIWNNLSFTSCKSIAENWMWKLCRGEKLHSVQKEFRFYIMQKQVIPHLGEPLF